MEVETTTTGKEKVAIDCNIVYDLVMRESGLARKSIVDTVTLLNEKATVPFIARYRKERTGGLDETQIRLVADKWEYYYDLEGRKTFVLKTIEDLGKLTPELKQEIICCTKRQKLEDLYRPYKPKRRTKATIARERGLEPLADLIWQQSHEGDHAQILCAFINPDKEVLTTDDVLAGAIDILVERVSEMANLRGWLRERVESKGLLLTKVTREWQEKKSKFEMYYDFNELLKSAPSHRLLAIRRGAKKGIISWNIGIDEEKALAYFTNRIIHNKLALFKAELTRAIHLGYKRMYLSVEIESFVAALQLAEEEAMRVFSKNLNNLLLDAPAGEKMILAVDPGFRTGCKVAVLDGNGSFKEFKAIYPHPPQNETNKAAKTVLDLIEKNAIDLIAIGNGTAARETEAFIKSILPKERTARIVMVSEAGASVYSASEVAIKEFSQLDVTVRGAISIGRRLQDPLAELVKIDPKSIGVGQYQHDVNQIRLRKSLESVVESCVNYVGVELNTASRELLAYVSGIGPALADNIVTFRSQKGPFKSRSDLKQVSRLGDKAFEQSAGFLRVRCSSNQLDNSAIHPERYKLVEKMAHDIGLKPGDLIGKKALLEKIDWDAYCNQEVGKPTLDDIREELMKPGLDPRDNFENIEFSAEVCELIDLKEGMELLGKVTNVTNFGAFIDIGVHQDGLIHISKLSKKFVRDPHEIISVGEAVRVRVLSVDIELKRVSLERIKGNK